MRITPPVFGLVLVLFTSNPLYAAPLQWSVAGGGNNHWYEYVDTPELTWAQASAAASASLWNGVPGHLATLTSAAEDSWVWSNLNPSRAWLGATQDRTISASADGWSWVTAEIWEYTNWQSNEPNDQGTGDEWALQYDQYGKWNDVDGELDLTVPGYVVEYEASPVPTKPSTWGKIKSLYR